MRLLYPDDRDDVTVEDLYAVPRPRPAGRPWVAVVMIASLDGSTSVAGRSGGLGRSGDRAVFAALRAAADVIVVGATTAAIERYGPTDKPGQRVGVVTSSAAIDRSADLWRSGAGFLITPVDAPPPPPGIDTVRAGTGRVDIASALASLGDATGSEAGLVVVEGGATLNGSVLAAGCVDELDLTLAPLLVGGAGPRLATGVDEHVAAMRPAHLAVDDDGYLYARYVTTRHDQTTDT